MPTKESTLRINIDVDRASAKAIKLANELEKIGISGDKSGVMVERGMNQAERGIRSAADTSAAAAVRFQTMTNGMINLSTAGIQTYTSISNLDRAMNRAKASAVSFERAEDLLARKQFMLNEEMKKSQPNLQKIALLRGELATATNDLAVKEEKLRIEQSAVLDVQLLFAANLLNVGVSSIQVFATMIGVETAAMIKSTIATKLKNLATWENFRASRAAQLGVTGLGIGLGAESVAHGGATLATRLHTGALTALKIALGPIGLIFIGISAAMAAYETNALGLKDTIHGLLGIQDEFTDSTKDARLETDMMIGSTENLASSVGKIPDSYQSARIAMDEYRESLRKTYEQQNLVAQATKQLNSGLPTSLSGFNRATRPQGVLEQIGSFFNFLPSAHADVTPFKGSNELQVLDKFGLSNNINPLGSLAGVPVGIDLSQELEQTAFGFAYMELFTNSPDFRKGERQRAKLLQFARQLETGSKFLIDVPNFSAQFDPAIGGEFLVSDKVNKTLSKILGRDITDYEADFFYKAVRSGKINNITDQERDLVQHIGGQRISHLGKMSVTESQRLSQLSNREFIKQAMFVDIGQVANSMSRTDALRIAVIEKDMAKNGLSGIATGGATGFQLQAAIANGLSATALFQANRGSIKVPAWVKRQIEEQDRYANSGLMSANALIERIFNPNTRIPALSRSGSGRFRRDFQDTFNYNPNVSSPFGIDDIAREQLALLEEKYGEPTVRKYVQAKLGKALEISAGVTNRAESFISSSLGIDFDANAPRKRIQIYWGGRKGNQRYAYVSTKPSVQAQIAADIGASGGIVFPTGQRLLDVTRAFNTNGNFSNFNNIGITDNAMAVLNLSEQKVFDIRFNSTRGDRELLNRLRHVQLMQSGSSGTSPL